MRFILLLSRCIFFCLLLIFVFLLYSCFLYRTDDDFLGNCNNGAIIIGSFGGSGVQLLSFFYPSPQWTLATFVIFFFGGILGLAGTKTTLQGIIKSCVCKYTAWIPLCLIIIPLVVLSLPLICWKVRLGAFVFAWDILTLETRNYNIRHFLLMNLFTFLIFVGVVSVLVYYV